MKSVYIGNSSEAVAEVTNGVKTRIFVGVRGFIRPNMSGEYFKISVKCGGQIRGITAVAEVVDGI